MWSIEKGLIPLLSLLVHTILRDYAAPFRDVANRSEGRISAGV